MTGYSLLLQPWRSRRLSWTAPRPYGVGHAARPWPAAPRQPGQVLRRRGRAGAPGGRAARGAHHDGRVPVAQHVAAKLQQAPPEPVGVGVQRGQLGRAAAAAVLAAQQPQRGHDLLRGRRRHTRRVVVPRRHAPQVGDHVPARLRGPGPDVCVTQGLTRLRAARAHMHGNCGRLKTRGRAACEHAGGKPHMIVLPPLRLPRTRAPAGGNVAAARAERLGERAHHDVDVGRVHAGGLARAAPARAQRADAVRLVQVQVRLQQRVG